MNNPAPVSVNCPVCRKKGDWFAGNYGPFCSKRCKLVDLGKWFGGEYAVSEPLPTGQFPVAEDRESESLRE